MRPQRFAAACAVALVLTTTPLATGSAVTDYIIAEPPMGSSDAPPSLSGGATVGPHGRYYFPLRYHYTSDIGRSHAELNSYFKQVTLELNRLYQESGIDLEFVLEEISPIGFASSEDNLADLTRYRDTYQPDGRFGMLLVPHGGGIPLAYVMTQPWEQMPLRSIMPMSQFFPELITLHATTVAHEIGHNLGLRHGGECPTEGNSDGCGYITPGSRFTVMGGVVHGETPTNRFSDPTYIFDGEALGDAWANSVRFVTEERLPGYAPFMAQTVPPCETGEIIRFGHTNRFEGRVCWRTEQGTEGNGHLAVPSRDSAVVWFFDLENWEMLIKVKDACIEPFNRYWIFFAATTHVEFTLTVTDTEHGVSKTYFNPLGQAASTVNDTNAFATCP